MEINVFGRIGVEVTADEVARYLSYSANEDITVKISSYGGDISEAHAIYNLLRDYKGKVYCEIIGMCASAATIIAMAGDTIKMKSNALFMIHEVSIGLSDVVQVDDLEKLVEGLKRTNDTLVEVYQTKTKLSSEEILSMMKSETWMNAIEAKMKGFIDEILPIREENNEKTRESLKAQYIAEERARVAKLNEYPAKNEASRAIVQVAVANGQTLDDIQPFLNAISKENEIKTKKTNEFEKILSDYLISGAESVGFNPNISKSAIDNGVLNAMNGYKEELK